MAKASEKRLDVRDWVLDTGFRIDDRSLEYLGFVGLVY